MATKRKQLELLLLCFFLVTSVAQPDALERVNTRFRVTDVLQSLSETIEDGFHNKHATALNCSCAHHACSHSLDLHHICSDRVGSADVCGESCTTRKLSLEYGYVSTPPNSDPKNLSPIVVEESCIYEGLQMTFRRLEPIIYSWIYFGTSGGITITYPGAASARGFTEGPSDVHFGHCEQYDPRARPWYSDATSAPKDIVFLMDASSSMALRAGLGSSMTRWELGKDVAKTAIDLLHFADTMRLVIVGDENFEQNERPALLEASDTNKVTLKEKLDEAKPHGEKRTEEGLKTAFHTFQRAQREEIRSTGCQQVIFWITDGRLCAEGNVHDCTNQHEKVHGILDSIERQQATLEPSHVYGKASIFVITVGEDADFRLPQRIACLHNGTHMHIHPGRDILEQLLPYISFFAGQLVENEKRISWSRFYEDFSGLGLMTTATRPMFSHATNGPRRGRLLGVLAVDIPLTTLEDNGLSYSEVLGQLSRHIGQCTVYPIDQCQVQILRGKEKECPRVHPKAECYKDAQTGRVYFISSGSQQHNTFEKSQQQCQDMGGTLAEIRSVHDQALLSGLVSIDSAWIGLKLSEKEEEWHWLSGKNRKIETRDGFWAIRDIDVNAEKQCAAMDSRGTRYNVAARSCQDQLDYICEFKNANEAPDICTDELYLIELDSENPMPSIHDCTGDMDVRDDTDFFNIRNRENDAPVFCPMSLDDPLDNAEALCCESCLEPVETRVQASLEKDEEDVDDHALSSAHRMHHAHSLFLFISFSLLPFFLYWLF